MRVSLAAIALLGASIAMPERTSGYTPRFLPAAQTRAPKLGHHRSAKANRLRKARTRVARRAMRRRKAAAR